MNTEIVNEIRNALKTQINDKIQQPIPVIEVNPKVLKNAYTLGATATNATSASATPNTAKQQYIIGASLSLIKDATSTSTLSTITYTTVDGQTKELIRIPGITLTAQQQSISVSLPHPLPIKLGTSIAVTNATNVANILASMVVYLFEDDCTNA